MKNLLAKEKILYDTVANSLSDKDFFIGFHAYFTFILGGGDKVIIDQIAEKFISRIEEEKSIEAIKDKIAVEATKLLDELTILSKKLGLHDNQILQEEIQSTHSLLNGSTYVFGGEFLNSLYDDFFDILKRISDLGYQKEIESFVELSPSSTIKDIHALKERKDYLHKRDSFLKKDARTEEGSFFRLMNLFKEISVLENTDFNSLQIDIENVFRIHAARKMNNEYSMLMSGEIQKGAYYKKEKYMPDIERIHNFIILNSLDIKIEEKGKYPNKIFFVKNDNIFHHEIGLLHYEKNGLREPKYIQMFKNVITYMPAEKDKVRISELEKHINKKDQHGANYRVNLGKSAKSFNNFLKKNGIKNIHPEKKVPILSVTDEYITFHNKISSE